MKKNKATFSKLFHLFLNKQQKEVQGITKNHSEKAIQGPLGRRADADSHCALRMEDLADY